MQAAQSGASEATIQQVARQALEQFAGQKGNLLPILHAVQHALGYIPDTAVPTLAQALQLSRAEVHGVVRFYANLRTTPPGKMVLEVCRAESCQAMGGDALADHAKNRLGCDFHSTSANGEVTLEPVYCLGLCAQSPAVMIDGEPYARMTPAKLDKLLGAKEVQS
ncbi:MAG: formate dehydrogenase subunit gamma [Burkholderiaceae bacterium]|nr:MAG: formate dehydrogenase subunit gamma [Burkholderiaceae bacterium]TAM10966.1 MAG: formate dehydrogenase subunit gamma [Pusillimonas sp.]